jgi:hypothetical protein
MTSYETVYNRFFQKCTDYELPNLPDDELEAMLHGWLLSSIAKFRKCESDLTQRDDELRTFLVDLLNEEIEILALLMTVEWLEPTINSVLLTNMMVGGKEEKWFSQSSHLAELQALRDANRLEAKKLMRDYTYANHSYLSE